MTKPLPPLPTEQRVPRPLTTKMKKKLVDLGLAGAPDPAELAKLTEKFAKPERTKAEPIKSRDRNGYKTS